MATKAELEEELNDKLEVHMEWSRMKKDDLVRLLELVDNGLLVEPMLKNMAKEKGTEAAEELIEGTIDDWYPGKYAGAFL